MPKGAGSWIACSLGHRPLIKTCAAGTLGFIVHSRPRSFLKDLLVLSPAILLLVRVQRRGPRSVASVMQTFRQAFTFSETLETWVRQRSSGLPCFNSYCRTKQLMVACKNIFSLRMLFFDTSLPTTKFRLSSLVNEFLSLKFKRFRHKKAS